MSIVDKLFDEHRSMGAYAATNTSGGQADSVWCVFPGLTTGVEIRGSSGVAAAKVRAQGPPSNPADEASAQLNHDVRRQSIDERRADQLSIIWRLELGQAVTQARGLPGNVDPLFGTGVADPNALMVENRLGLVEDERL